MRSRSVVGEGSRRILLICSAVAWWAILSGNAIAGPITLAWSPNPEPDITGYRVLVGTAPGVYTQTFDVPSNRTTFTFSSATTGIRYYFAVAAQVENVFGPVSAEVWSDDRLSTLSSTAERSLSSGDVSSLSAPVQPCRSSCVTVVTSSTGEITGLTALPQGGVMYVEAGTRVVGRAQGEELITLMAAANDERILQATLDPQFSTNGLAYVSVARPSRDPSSEVDIVRHRYVGGTFGEPATIVSGITLPAGRAVPFVMSDDGLIYVAAPAGGGRRDPYAASVLVFDRAGRVPADQTPATPVIAAGFEAPLALAWDAAAKRVWVAGRNAGDRASLKAVRRDAIPTTADGDRRAAEALMAALSNHPATGVATSPQAGAMAVSTDEAVVLAGGREPAARTVDVSAFGKPTAVAVGPGGETYVVVRPSESGGSLILKLPVASVASAR